MDLRPIEMDDGSMAFVKEPSRPGLNGKLKERFERLPEFCYSVIAGNAPGKRIGIIKRGEAGYYLTDFDSPTAPKDLIEQVVAEQNRKMGVKPSQVEAMEIGSCFGWDVPGADPEKYKNLDETSTPVEAEA